MTCAPSKCALRNHFCATVLVLFIAVAFPQMASCSDSDSTTQGTSGQQCQTQFQAVLTAMKSLRVGMDVHDVPKALGIANLEFRVRGQSGFFTVGAGDNFHVLRIYFRDNNSTVELERVELMHDNKIKAAFPEAKR